MATYEKVLLDKLTLCFPNGLLEVDLVNLFPRHDRKKPKEALKRLEKQGRIYKRRNRWLLKLS